MHSQHISLFLNSAHSAFLDIVRVYRIHTPCMAAEDVMLDYI